MKAHYKPVLMAAYHSPPLAGSSGTQRTLRFVNPLPAFGWQPLVLTAYPRTYERTSDDLNADVPPEMVVRRAFALDTARHLSQGGRYAGAMARPGRWVSGRFDAVRVGLQMIRKPRPAAIWATYPIATAHLICAEPSRRTELALRVLGDASFIRAASRRGRTEALAKLLNGITGTATRP